MCEIHGWFQSLNSWVWCWLLLPHMHQLAFHMGLIHKKPPNLSVFLFQDLQFPHWCILSPLPVTKKSLCPASDALTSTVLWPCFLSSLLMPRARRITSQGDDCSSNILRRVSNFTYAIRSWVIWQLYKSPKCQQPYIWSLSLKRVFSSSEEVLSSCRNWAPSLDAAVSPHVNYSPPKTICQLTGRMASHR